VITPTHNRIRQPIDLTRSGRIIGPVAQKLLAQTGTGRGEVVTG
jgi:hypothetical protein